MNTKDVREELRKLLSGRCTCKEVCYLKDDSDKLNMHIINPRTTTKAITVTL